MKVYEFLALFFAGGWGLGGGRVGVALFLLLVLIWLAGLAGFTLLFFFFQTGSHYDAQAGLERA